jgi:hypothetical protein
MLARAKGREIMRHGAIAVMVTTVVAVVGLARGQSRPASQPAGIQQLVQQLGHKDYSVRQAATGALEKLGFEALEALEAATKSQDPEVSVRAAELLDKLRNPAPAQLDALRAECLRAATAGDVDLLLASARKLGCVRNGSPEDLLWLGYAYQTAGDWPRTVQAYQAVLAMLDAPPAAPAPRLNWKRKARPIRRKRLRRRGASSRRGPI